MMNPPKETKEINRRKGKIRNKKPKRALRTMTYSMGCWAKVQKTRRGKRTKTLVKYLIYRMTEITMMRRQLRMKKLRIRTKTIFITFLTKQLRRQMEK
eukprot:UN31984